MIVTIDGPAGSGKSTAARGLAARLGFQFLDTGAMYRAVALLTLEKGIQPDDRESVAEIAQSLDLVFQQNRVLIDATDVTEAIRTPEVTHAASKVAENTAVRSAMVELQRNIAEGKNVVTEGRDQGTVAFPHAECKFFLVADPRERAGRRQRELESQGTRISVDEILQQIEDRDSRDAGRAVSPLKPAEDAVQIDTSEKTIEEILELLEQTIREKMDVSA